MRIKHLLLFQFCIIILSGQVFSQETGNIKGFVKDALTGEPLIGANIILKGTSFGAATDFKGEYIIRSVPKGKYILMVSYIGYIAEKTEITVSKNRTLEQTFKLNYTVVNEDEVIVTAQAEGQMNAINKQLSSKSIKNVVSAKQIQELPDANAAEAIGRLPGVSLLRNGGEGSKVVIRGLSPQYSKIQVEGVSMSATGEGENGGERSSDLSMISPYMLEGIEVTKAALPNQEADVIGGTVNFILREAPKDFHFDVLSQSSYNGLKSELGDYKLMFSGSNRFFDNKLGVFAQFDLEKRNRSSYDLGVNYDPGKLETTISSVNLNDFDRKLKRYGGTFVLDYKLPNGKVQLNSFISGINKHITKRFESHNIQSLSHNYSLEDFENDLLVMTNLLKVEHNLFGGQFDIGVSYSYSENNTPMKSNFTGSEINAYDASVNNFSGPPIEVPNYAKNDYSNIILKNMFISDLHSLEGELGAFIDYKYDFNIKDFANFSIKTGYKYKTKKKEFDKNQDRVDFVFNSINNDIILKTYPWMEETVSLGTRKMPFILFHDPDYDGSNFLNGEYEITNMPKVDLMTDIAKLLKRTSPFYHTNYTESQKDDYYGDEYYNAAYVMSEIKIGHNITFISGIRYEKNTTTYKGARGSAVQWKDRYPHYDTTTTRQNEFWLPMVHLRYKPLDWFDIRLAYTETLSRPNYNSVIPFWYLGQEYITWNNPQLKPAHSTNYDIYASFYNNEIGLFTIGYFKKSIADMLFWSGNNIVLNNDKYGIPATETGKRLGTMINNPFAVKLNGFEVDWKTNFWYLPSVLKGLVLSVNYTYTFSEAKYPKTIIKYVYVPRPSLTVKDSFYVDRLVNQPSNIINFTLGYDYKGFSTRISLLYQDDIFKRTHFYKTHRGISIEFYKLDVSIRQKLPIEGLELFSNISNITNTIEEDINVGTGYPLRKQQYGMTLDVGLRYRY